MPTQHPYRTLQPERIVETAIRLERRIAERFPDSGLGRISQEVVNVASEAVVTAEHLSRPYTALRVIFGLFALCIVASLIATITLLRVNQDIFELEHFIQSLEASIASVVFVGAAIAFLMSIEIRWKRERALAAMRELRNMAHIIDMHQLTKDPESTVRGGPSTPSSPKRTLDRFQLGRYLDYCTELLSLISKIGAIYVRDFNDSVVLEAANQLSDLANGLSRNIWQKIMILEGAAPGAEEPRPTSGPETSPPAAIRVSQSSSEPSSNSAPIPTSGG